MIQMISTTRRTALDKAQRAGEGPITAIKLSVMAGKIPTPTKAPVS
jgi:hypothetical protein